MNRVEPFYSEVGLRIQALRNQNGMSQEQLGRRLDPPVTRASIANIEAGKQRVLAHTLVQLAEVLDVELSALLPAACLKQRYVASPGQGNVEAELAEKLGLPKKDVRQLAARLKKAAGGRKS
jgi:transcriptional regulator with XRE-family HTH domain